MKNIFFTILTIVTICSVAQGNFEKPEIFNAAPGNVYTPQGFDTNDNVEFLFDGQFTDGCYREGLTFTEVDESNKEIYITDTGHYFNDTLCAEVLRPYQKKISAGMLTQGTYTVFFKNSRGNFVEGGRIPVVDAKTPAPDDYLYAPVEKSEFIRKTGDRPYQLVLKGKFHDSCMRLDKVRLNHRPPSNVVDILPLAKMVEGDCQHIPDGINFEQTVDLSQLDAGRFLLHIRALNGRSVNEIVEIN